MQNLPFKKITIKEKNQEATLYYCHSSKFKTFYTYCIFFKEYEKKSSLVFETLGHLLNHTTRLHPTEEELSLYLANLYDMYHRVYTSQYPKFNYMVFRTGTVNTRYIHEDINLLEEASKLLHESIFEPNFSLEILEDIKLTNANKIINAQNNKLNMVSKAFNQDRFKNELIEEQMYIEPEEILSITMEDVKKEYSNLLTYPHIYIYIGEDKEEDVVKALSGFDLPISKDATLDGICRYEKTIDNVKEVSLDSTINQSHLFVGLRTNIYYNDPKYYAMLFCELLLGGSYNSELFRVVRKDNSLVYDISLRYNSRYGFLTISAGLAKKNMEKAYELIKKSINNFKEGKISSELLEIEKKNVINGIKAELDEIGNHYHASVAHFLNGELKTTEERISLINKLTIEDIKEAAQSIVYDTVYFVRGVENESN